MTACQTLAQSLSASPSATSYPTTQFSLPPSFHHEISDLSAYNRSFPSKIKCCVDRLSWLHKDGVIGRPACRSLEILGAALQADGGTRSAFAASSIRRRSAAWTILPD